MCRNPHSNARVPHERSRLHALCPGSRRRRPGRASGVLGDALKGADDGELFMERSESEFFRFDDGRLKSASYDSTEGFGLRVVAGETAGFAHASEITEAGHRRAAASAALAKRGLYRRRRRRAPGHQRQALRRGRSPRLARLRRKGRPAAGDRRLRPGPRPPGRPGDGSLAGERRVGRDPARRRPADSRCPPPGASQCATDRGEGRPARERLRPAPAAAPASRPGSRQKAGRSRSRRRCARPWSTWTPSPAPPAKWTWCWAPAGTACCCTRRWAMAWKAISTAREPRPSPAASASAWRRRASPCSTTGPIAGRRGSLTVDDEGTPTERTILIEDGMLVGYMHDRQSARLMGMTPTGNGRRQSYAHMPMPRMTNTGMLAGNLEPRRDDHLRPSAASTAPTSAAARWTSPTASSSSSAPRPI